MESIISILVLGIIILILRTIFKKIKFYHSNWNILIDDFKYSTDDFYKLFKEELKATQVRGISYENIGLSQGVELLSQKRKYLRVQWKDYRFDLCAAPFGRGMFFSWWLIYKLPLIAVFIYIIPFIGKRMVRFLFPITYYKIDSASMFMRYTHLVMLKVIDTITTENGVRILTDDERKPILHDPMNIFNR